MKISRKSLFIYSVVIVLVSILTYGTYFIASFLRSAALTGSMSGAYSTEAATHAFEEMYNALPGDIANPSNIKLCQTQICAGGNGDGKIGESVFSGMDLSGTESALYWRHLYAADLAVEGRETMEDALGGMIFPIFTDGKTPLPLAFSDSAPLPGHFLIWMKGHIIGKDSAFLKPEYAFRLDLKMDDGLPLSGKVIAAGDSRCVKEDSENIRVYNLKNHARCFLYYRLNALGE